MSEQAPPFDTLDKIKTFLDDVSLGHSQSIYDTYDYDEVKNEVLENLREVFTKAEKLDRLLTLFQDQPDQVIQWTPDKRHYSWAFPSRTRACKMLEEILEILLEESINNGAVSYTHLTLPTILLV